MVIKINYTSSDVYVSTSVSPVYVVVNYSAVNNGGVAWGTITGTLSNQTDLQNALDAKVPYTGATTNVNLGEFELKAGQMTLDITPTGTAAVGTTRWNDTLGSSETTLKGGSVILKNGVDLVARVVNKVTPNATLTKAAYQAVRVSGAQGQRLAVAYAQANNDANSADTIGLVTETIATNQEGFIMAVGQLENINTTGSLQGETWVDGDVLYLSPTVPGGITNIKPLAPQHLVVIGYVEYAHVNNGKIYVKIMNGWELGELHDVNTTGVVAGQVLKYNGTIWTPSADSGITGSGAAGQVAYFTGATTQAGSNNLFWDNANGRLGIGTNSPQTTLHIQGGLGSFRVLSSGAEVYLTRDGNNDFLANGGTSAELSVGANNALKFWTGTTLTERARITAVGNLLVGSTLDGGQRLQVYGDAFIKGSGNTSATTALTVQNSDGTVYLQFINDGRLQLGTASNNVQIFPFNTSQAPSLTSRNLMFYSPNGSQVASEGRFKFDGNGLTQTSGIVINIKSSSIFSPTSGTATYQELNVSPQINQTGGANGITRGLYVNPTLTAAADWHSIEWSNNSGWGLYGAGTANNYFNGGLLVGTTTTVSGYKLVVSGSIYASTHIRFDEAIRDNRDNTIISQSLSSVVTNRILTIGNGTYLNINFPNGNVLVGTTTDAGFKLDVNGTARVTGASTFARITATTSGIELDYNSGILYHAGGSGSYYQYIDGVSYTFRSRTATGSLIFATQDIERMRLTSGGNLLVGTTTDNGSRFQVSGAATFSSTLTVSSRLTLNGVGTSEIYTTDASGLYLTAATSGGMYLASESRFIFRKATSPFTEYMRIESTGNVCIGTISSSASAILQADSTTKGFLPPRMTTTQKNAIGTPAAGLQVYDTTLNQMSYYNGTTWVNF